MKQNKIGNLAIQLEKENKGYILTMSVLIISAIISIVVISTSLSSLIVLDKNNEDLKGVKINQYTQGCMDEALIQTSRNKNYTGGTYNIGFGTCEISVVGDSSDSREIFVTGTIENRKYFFKADVGLNPFELKKWDS